MGTGRPALDSVDHLLLGAADLERGIDWLEARTGVRAAPGGSHPGVGTRNALASLGGRHYLEIIAPDPAQSAFNFQIDLRRLPAPRLVTWAASTANPDEVAAAATRAGLGVFGPRDGSRMRPDGTMLRWRTVGVEAKLGDGTVDPVPFFIAWAADARHPSQDAPSGCRLSGLEIAAPDPARLKEVLSILGLDAVVGSGSRPTLRATLETPKGSVTIE
jgi:glyoxalase-like protein